MYESPETNKPNRESLKHFSRKKSPWEEKSLNHLSLFQKFALQKNIYNYQQLSDIYISHKCKWRQFLVAAVPTNARDATC